MSEEQKDTAVNGAAPAVAPEAPAIEKTKKLTKSIQGSVITITEGVTKKSATYDLAELSDSIKFNLSMHGLSQKLGDAAAGKTGEEALKSIQIVYDGLKKGDWTVRAPAGEKITKSAITEKLGQLSEKEQAVAKSLLAKLGVKI